MTEIWKDIPGFGGHYQASSIGRIRTKDRIVRRAHPAGMAINFRYKGRVLKPTNTRGYLVVHIGVDGVKTNLAVHVAVLLAFVGPRPDGMEGCHCNGDSLDNRAENLRWDTHLANNRDRLKHETYTRGQRHPMAKLTDAQALEIYRSSESGAALAKRYGVAPSKISAIRCGQTWSHVTGGVDLRKAKEN